MLLLRYSPYSFSLPWKTNKNNCLLKVFYKFSLIGIGTENINKLLQGLLSNMVSNSPVPHISLFPSTICLLNPHYSSFYLYSGYKIHHILNILRSHYDSQGLLKLLPKWCSLTFKLVTLQVILYIAIRRYLLKLKKKKVSLLFSKICFPWLLQNKPINQSNYACITFKPLHYLAI